MEENKIVEKKITIKSCFFPKNQLERDAIFVNINNGQGYLGGV